MNQPSTPSFVKDLVREYWAGRASTFDAAPNHGLHNDEQRMAWLARVRGWWRRSGRDDWSISSRATAECGTCALDALDVGCGTGFLALLLAEVGHRVTGVDAAEEMLALARDKATRAGLLASFQRGDAEALPLPAASFDLLVERHVIWTLPEPSVALAEWARVLRPGGCLVLVEGDWQGSGTPAYEPIRDALPLYGGRPAGELAAFVAQQGFVDVEIEPLMDGVLWGSEPERERYALHARRPR